jgi:hypothetical protein
MKLEIFIVVQFSVQDFFCANLMFTSVIREDAIEWESSVVEVTQLQSSALGTQMSWSDQ